MNSFFRKLTWLTRRPGKEAELQEELQFHLDEETEERAGGALDAAQARLAARRDLGNLTRVQEDTRAAWSWAFVEQLLQDIRYAVRSMGAHPTFSALAILSLALGIGANTAIFSFMDSILLRSLPVPNPESLVTLSWRMNSREMHGMNRHDDSFLDRDAGFGGSIFAYPALEMFRKNDSIFSTVFGYQGAGDLHLAIGNQAEIANTEYVTGDYFKGLGIPPAAGRLIMADDDRAGAPSVAVISSALSQRYFGGAANAAGQPIRIDNLPFIVIGVVPVEFFGADPGLLPDVYVPMHANLLLEGDQYHYPASASYTDPNYEWVITMARLRPGVSRTQAQAVLSPQFSEWMRTVNTERTRSDLPTLLVRDGRAGLSGLRQQYSKPLFILLAVVALILAIACANIANLLLARAAARRREIAVRLSIGAGRWRVVRQLLTESIMLASIGGVIGIAFALWGIRFLTALLANGREDFTLHADLNWHVLIVAAGLALLTGTLFGLAPALQSTRVDLLPALKESRAAGTRSHGRRRLTLSRALMVAQMAISLVILVAAGLFVRSLSHLESIQLGFNRENVLTFRLNASRAGHPDSEVPAFYNHLRARFAAIPGVRSASLSDMPLLGGRVFAPVSAAGGQPKTSFIWAVGADFFTTMQIPILLGREIQARDMSRSHLAAVVNQEFAQKNFAGANPLGQFLNLPEDCPQCAIEIVGVSGDVLIGRDVRDERGPTVFLPFTTWGRVEGMAFELRTAGDPLTYVRTVRELVRQADPRLPVSEIRTQRALIDGTMNREVVFARLCTGFGLLALAIACIGLYGAMSYNVARRTAEIGIRMALGAERGRVVWMVLREVLLLAAAGLAISIPAALFATKLLGSFLFETKPNDPVSLVVAAASLVTAAALAGFLPARNASRIDPMSALRHE
jgi:macrolide transport system ATP-binding/permease protein